MSKNAQPKFRVVNNPYTPLTSGLTSKPPKLTVKHGSASNIENEMTISESAGEDPAIKLSLAFNTVESALRAENWFLKTVRTELAKSGSPADYPTVYGSNGHDYLVHFTQFLFFLKALDCTDPDQISNFIEAHNAKIESKIRDPEFTKSLAEQKKALIRPERKAKILDTVRLFRRPVFAIYDFGHFLIDEMSPKTTEKLIEDLRFGKVLERRVDERMAADQKRILIGSTGFLESTYQTSLLMQRRMIAQGMTEKEFKVAQGS